MHRARPGYVGPEARCFLKDRPRDTALTPTGRVEELKKKLEAMRQSAAAIGPALGRFYEVLDASNRPATNRAAFPAWCGEGRPSGNVAWRTQWAFRR